MKNLIIIFVIILSCNTVKAQLQGQAKIDSLLKELPKMKEDTNGVNLLKDLSFLYYGINPDEGIKYGKQGLKIAKNINWKLGSAKCYNSLGVVYSFGKSDYPKAIENYKKALKISEELGNKRSVAFNLGNIGGIYITLSNYPEALTYFLKSLKICEEIGNREGIAYNLGNLGNINISQSNFPKALEYYQKALKINEEIRNKSSIASQLGNIGLAYSSLLEFLKALEYYHKALKIYEEIGYKSGITSQLGNIGTIYNNQSNYLKALEYYLKALEINKEINNTQGIASNFGSIGKMYLDLAKDSVIAKSENKLELLLNKETNLNKSIEYIQNSLTIYKENAVLIYQFYYLDLLSQAYELKGDYQQALDFYKESKVLNDSIYSSENQTKIAKLEAKRENEVKQKEIVILKKEKENEKLQRYAMFGGIAGLGIIIGLILIQRRKSEKLLLNVLPVKIAKRLKAKEHPIADHFDGASIIFIDIVGFTKLSSDADPKRIVSVLNDIFTIFDKLADKYGLEKIKTIGDAYMAVAGIPEIQADHAKRTAQMALDIKKEMKDFKTSHGTEIKFRIGIDCGAVVAGVIGEKKFIYDLWSDAVNTASRMESTGESGQIQITENFKEELEKFDGNWNFTLRGEFDIKGKGLMKTYFLEENNLGEL
jgi:class 3 adenylate cyclase